MTGGHKAPLLEAMRVYARGGAFAFHTPGHKQGLGAAEELRSLITDEGLQEEVSLTGELDNLYQPKTYIKEAESLAADLFGADRTFFSVIGTTGLIEIMLLSTLKPSEKIIVSRNAHRSFFASLVLTGGEPIYLDPVIDDVWGIAHGVTVEEVKRKIEAHPDAKAVFLVYPTYYGVTSDLKEIARIVHEHDMLLLVDEAHGAHLKFADKLPPSAITLGADMVAQSTHKLLGSLTQTSWLHIMKKNIDEKRVEEVAALISTTSPNYLLLASLDIARLQMEKEGTLLVKRLMHLAEDFRHKIAQVEGLQIMGIEILQNSATYGLDITKLTISARKLGYTGRELATFLRTEGVQAELVDAENVLFLTSFADTEEKFAFLYEKLHSFSKKMQKKPLLARVKIPPLPHPKVVMTPRDAFFAPAREMDFKDAIGKVSAETILFYPPGIPILSPGEMVTTDIVDYISFMKEKGLLPLGKNEDDFSNIKCILQ